MTKPLSKDKRPGLVQHRKGRIGLRHRVILDMLADAKVVREHMRARRNRLQCLPDDLAIT